MTPSSPISPLPAVYLRFLGTECTLPQAHGVPCGQVTSKETRGPRWERSATLPSGAWVPCGPWMRLRPDPPRWSNPTSRPTRGPGGPERPRRASRPPTTPGPALGDGPVPGATDPEDPEGPPFGRPARTAIAVGVVAVMVAALVLRFWTRSDLWLDEALTVNIARLPLHQIPSFLRRDGAPPLFYVLLHVWMGWFGTSDVAVRSLSGVLGVVTVPLAWVAGAGSAAVTVGWAAMLLVATSPFATRYDTEARMYSLVVLLDPARVPGARPVAAPAASRQPHRPRRGDRPPALHPLLVVLPDRHHHAVVGLAGVAGPPRVAAGGPGLVGGRGGGVPDLPPLAPHLPLPVQAHRHPLGHAGQLRRHGQRGGLVRRRGAPARAGPWPSSSSPWPGWACSVWPPTGDTSTWTSAPARWAGPWPSSSWARWAPPSPGGS